MKLFQNVLLAATLSNAQRAQKRKVLKSKLVCGKFLPIVADNFAHFETFENFHLIFSISNFAFFLYPVITSISEIESNGDRTTEEEDSMFYMESPPTEACTFFGKHAYTNEDGFGMEYKYNLEFQGTILNVVLSYFYRLIFTCTSVAD